MSEVVGPLTFGKKEEQVFLGRDFSQSQDYSEGTATSIDGEVKRIVTDNYERAKKELEEHKKELVRIAEELLVREVLDGEQVRRIARGLPLDDPADDSTAGSTSPSGDVSSVDDDSVSIVPPVPSLDKAVPQE